MKLLFKFSMLLLIVIPLTISAQIDFWQQTNGPAGGSVWAVVINANGDILPAPTMPASSVRPQMEIPGLPSIQV